MLLWEDGRLHTIQLIWPAADRQQAALLLRDLTLQLAAVHRLEGSTPDAVTFHGPDGYEISLETIPLKEPKYGVQLICTAPD